MADMLIGKSLSTFTNTLILTFSLAHSLFSLHSFFLFSCWYNVTPFTLHAVLVYFQVNYENFCSIFKLTRVEVGNISKKGKNMKGIIAWSIFTKWFFNWTLCINDKKLIWRIARPTPIVHAEIVETTFRSRFRFCF